MTDKEIKELEERTYAIGWSGFPIDVLFNDIRDNNNPRFNKDLAYQDFKKVIDEIYRLKEIEKQQSNPTFSDCIKEWEERGWTVDELKQFPIIKIWKLNKEQRVVDNIYVFNKTLKSKIDFDADYETLNLLTKTLKALEEMKDD